MPETVNLLKEAEKINYLPTPFPAPRAGWKYCECENPQHGQSKSGNCSIQVIVPTPYCEWCNVGCMSRINV